MSKYAPAIQQLQEVCDAYDNSGSEKIASVRNKLKEILKHTKLAMECTINPEVACPHPLNRPFEKNRMVDVGSQVVNQGFDLTMCSGACAVEDVPNTLELENSKA